MQRKHEEFKEILKRVLPDPARERIYSIDLVSRRWEDVVGTHLARRSEPEALLNGVLTVRVTEAEWGKMIYRVQDRIVPALNNALGGVVVKRINFTKRRRLEFQANVAKTVLPRKSKPSPPPDVLIAAANHIQDGELREVVLKSATRYLRAQREHGRQ